MGSVFAVLEAAMLAPGVKQFRIEAPRVARHRRAGQFVIVRVTPEGERIPLTIADADPNAGWISVIVQSIGKTTTELNTLGAGAALADVAGPLGTPSHIERVGTVVVIGGGVGTAIAYPTAVAMKRAGNRVIAIVGGRSRPYVLLEQELRTVCDEVFPCTDDGSYGYPGMVTGKLAEVLAAEPVHQVLAVGPIPMMRAVAELTRPSAIPTVVSLNPIMVDGTGMCGGCRVAVGGETRFACVDGPEFDAHQVDFELLARRNRAYLPFERERLADYEAGCRSGAAR
jgi:ferredoxin--NADP+ reductase